MNTLIQQIINSPLASLLIIGNLILIESLLSVDNAAVLATMVLALPRRERAKALKYGIFGAYISRGICLFIASYLVKIWWLKAVGGLYLIYLCANWLTTKLKQRGNEPDKKPVENRLYKFMSGRISSLWAAVISVELMDLAFSMDNVFAAVAFSNNILIILCGVFIGILAMRFVAQGFVKLIERFPFLESCAYLVIGLLGIKLSLSIYEHLAPAASLTKALRSSHADWLTSAITITIFIIPIVTNRLFNFPKSKDAIAGKEGG
jgi:YkoY family integral membrane protein